MRTARVTTLAAAVAIALSPAVALAQGGEGQPPAGEAVLTDPSLRLPLADTVPFPGLGSAAPIASAATLANAISDLGERRSVAAERIARLGFVGGVIRRHGDPQNPAAPAVTAWAAQFAGPGGARAGVHTATWIARGRAPGARVGAIEASPPGARLVRISRPDRARSLVLFAIGDWLYGVEASAPPGTFPQEELARSLALALAERMPEPGVVGGASPLEVTDALRAELRAARGRAVGHPVDPPTPGSAQAATYLGADWALAAFDGHFGDLELFRREPGRPWRALGDPGGPGCPRIPSDVAELWGLSLQCPPGSSPVTATDDHDATDPDLSPFRGPGMWVWQVGRAGGPRAIAATARRHGFRSVFVKSGDGTRYWRQFDAAARVLRANGIKVCAWQYVIGRRPAAEAAILARAARRGADCLIVDAESELKASGGRYAGPTHRRAMRYMAELRRRVGHRMPVALTSFAYADLHAEFPYSAFLGGRNGADVNMPQVYWGAFGTRVTRAMRRTMASNAVYGPIAPIAGTYRRERPGDLRRFRCIAAAHGSVGVSYWSLQHTRRVQLPALALPTTCADSAPAPREYPTSRFGHRGDTVTWLQMRLREWGSPVPRTGYYRAQTRAAVRAFQRAHGLQATGVATPRTWDLLLQRPR